MSRHKTSPTSTSVNINLDDRLLEAVDQLAGKLAQGERPSRSRTIRALLRTALAASTT